MNNVTLVGNLTKDAELKFTSNGSAVASFTLAVSRAFKNANGEKETDFINCVVWRKQAEVLAEYTGKGSKLAVRGRMQVRNYENKEGTRVYVTEVVVEEFTFLDSKKDKRTSQSGNDPFTKNSTEIDGLDNLPF